MKYYHLCSFPTFIGDSFFDPIYYDTTIKGLILKYILSDIKHFKINNATLNIIDLDEYNRAYVLKIFQPSKNKEIIEIYNKLTLLK